MWQEADLTVLFVTHNMREAVRLADRILMANGRMIHTQQVPLSRPRHDGLGGDRVPAAELTPD